MGNRSENEAKGDVLVVDQSSKTESAGSATMTVGTAKTKNTLATGSCNFVKRALEVMKHEALSLGHNRQGRVTQTIDG